MLVGMWPKIRLALALAVFLPAWALLGAFSTLDSGAPLWLGTSIGAGIGVLKGTERKMPVLPVSHCRLSHSPPSNVVKAGGLRQVFPTERPVAQCFVYDGGSAVGTSRVSALACSSHRLNAASPFAKNLHLNIEVCCVVGQPLRALRAQEDGGRVGAEPGRVYFELHRAGPGACARRNAQTTVVLAGTVLSALRPFLHHGVLSMSYIFSCFQSNYFL